MQFQLPSDDWRRKYVKWLALMLIFIVLVQIVPHAAAQNGPCGVWENAGAEARNNRMLMGGAALGLLIGFAVGGPFGLGITIGAMLIGGIAGGNDMAMAMSSC